MSSGREALLHVKSAHKCMKQAGLHGMQAGWLPLFAQTAAMLA
jgi:hypothetical protein